MKRVVEGAEAMTLDLAPEERRALAALLKGTVNEGHPIRHAYACCGAFLRDWNRRVERG